MFRFFKKKNIPCSVINIKFIRYFDISTDMSFEIPDRARELMRRRMASPPVVARRCAEGGNTSNPPQLTESPPKKKSRSGSNKLVRWCFTIKYECVISGVNSVRPCAEIAEILKGFCKEFYFQLEKSDSDYTHWQGCLATAAPLTFNQVKNLLFNDAHIEPCKDWFASKAYCQKPDTRLEGPYSHKSTFLDPKYLLKKADFYDWQTAIYDQLLLAPDDRHITWIYDPIGGNGKTRFVLHCVDNLGAVRYNSGKESDIAYSYNSEKIVLFDFQRSKPHINYSTMEDLKNGHLFSAKYESRAKRFNPPHVFVFANVLPEFEKMSLDRWIVYKLSDRVLTRQFEFYVDDERGLPQHYVLFDHEVINE